MDVANASSAVGYRHEALLYRGSDDFLALTLPVIDQAVEAGEPVLVAIDATKIDMLRQSLGQRERLVSWKDIRGIGGNPARIIPVWRRFVDGHDAARRLWGVGEPVWADRRPEELAEAQRHESLLNHAFDAETPFTLLCPYDTESLAPDVIAEAHRSHPHVGGSGGSAAAYADGEASHSFDAPLSEPAATPAELVAEHVRLYGLRAFLAEQIDGEQAVRVDDLAVAVTAVAGSMGRPAERSDSSRVRVRAWREPSRLIAEVSGLRRIADPLAGREWPAPKAGPTRGLWLANQLCDLVEFRSDERGSVVRLHADLGSSARS